MISSEQSSRLYNAVGRIVARKYYCCYCADHLSAALKVANKGPKAFLEAVATHDGMICGCAEWMRETAHEALDCFVAPND